MSTSRLYYRNLITPSTLAGFSVAGGAVAMAAYSLAQLAPYDYSAGHATFAISGTYTGTVPKDYVVQVTSSTNGTFAGTRYRWSDTDGKVTTGNPTGWNEENLTPVSGTPKSLSNGVVITFTVSSLAPEFVPGDEWDFRALRPFGFLYATDGSRNSEYRSGSLPTSSVLQIGFDMGTSVAPEFAVLDDHNLPSNAAVSLRSHATTIFSASPSHNQTITWQANRMAALVTASAARYWWIRIAMGATALDYVRLSEVFLGTGATFDLPPSIGASGNFQWLGSIDVVNHASRGMIPRIHAAAQRQYTWQYRKREANEDGGKLEAARTYAETHASNTMPPFYFLLFDDDLTSLEFDSWAGDLGKQHEYLDQWTYQTPWSEVIRTVAS